LKKGIIIEIDEGFLTLLTPDGEFLRARKQHNHYEIGQEIDFFQIAATDRKKPLLMNLFASHKGKTVAASALAILFSTILFFSFNQKEEVYAYMSFDINPSLELGVNDRLQVVELTSFNKEGQTIIEEIDDWKKKDLSIVTEKILTKIKEKGYINAEKDLVISTVYTGERESSPDNEILKELNKIESHLKKQDLEVTIVEGTAEEREKAIKQGVTTGTYKKQQEIIFKTSSSEKVITPVSQKNRVNNEISSKNQSGVKQQHNMVETNKEASHKPAPGLQKKEALHKQRELEEKSQKRQHEENSSPIQHKKQENKRKEHHENRDQYNKDDKSENQSREKNESYEKNNIGEVKNKQREEKNNLDHDEQKYKLREEKKNRDHHEQKNKQREKNNNRDEQKNRRGQENKKAGEEKKNTGEYNQRKKGDKHDKEKSGD
jgi:hypothetical protein